jgi:hypothetical protein
MLFSGRGFKYVGRWAGTVQNANRLVYSIDSALLYSEEASIPQQKNKAILQNASTTLFPIPRFPSLLLVACHNVWLCCIRPILGEAA